MNPITLKNQSSFFIIGFQINPMTLNFQVWFKNRRAKCRQQAKQQPPPSSAGDKLSLASRMKTAKKLGSLSSATSNGTSSATSLAVSSALKSSPRSTPSRDSPFDAGKVFNRSCLTESTYKFRMKVSYIFEFNRS